MLPQLTLMIRLLILFWLLPEMATAQALLAGSEYYDSFTTLAQVVILNAAHNEAGLDYLRGRGHIASPIPIARPVIIIARGREPESGCEFRFPESEALFWTFARNVATTTELLAPMVAAPLTSSSPALIPKDPTPTPTLTPVEKKKTRKKPTTKERSGIEWHMVDGQWKWRPLDPHAFKGVGAGASAPE